MRVLCIGFLLSGVAAFAAGYGDAGCGLGSMLFSNQSGGVQILAATTNGSTGTQTLGITSGTSNCDGLGLVLASRETGVFVSSNFDSLSQEMATGNGEHLDTLAALLGCNASEFASLVRSNYSVIFPEDATPEIFLHKMGESIRNSSLQCATI